MTWLGSGVLHLRETAHLESHMEPRGASPPSGPLGDTHPMTGEPGDADEAPSMDAPSSEAWMARPALN